MRIVGGARRGLTLRAPKGDGTRPTSDRLRETIFNILAHNHDILAGARVLDLFAGSGAMGLEALSRGAVFALFVETATAARGALRTNIDQMGEIGRTRIYRRDATRLGDCPVPPFGLVFCDPPYGKGLGERALAAAFAGGWVSDGAIAVLEERADAVPDAPAGWALIERRDAGESAFALYRSTG
ncbi:MAG: 16S rRNA (guanine(966)-N(2))-methyltransferase RsmD [Pseudomonadota bacterium]